MGPYLMLVSNEGEAGGEHLCDLGAWSSTISKAIIEEDEVVHPIVSEVIGSEGGQQRTRCFNQNRVDLL